MGCSKFGPTAWALIHDFNQLENQKGSFAVSPI
jgi:hypothetical protein